MSEMDLQTIAKAINPAIWDSSQDGALFIDQAREDTLRRAKTVLAYFAQEPKDDVLQLADDLENAVTPSGGIDMFDGSMIVQAAIALRGMRRLYKTLLRERDELAAKLEQGADAYGKVSEELHVLKPVNADNVAMVNRLIAEREAALRALHPARQSALLEAAEVASREMEGFRQERCYGEMLGAKTVRDVIRSLLDDVPEQSGSLTDGERG